MLRRAASVVSGGVLLVLAGMFGVESAQAAGLCGGKAATIAGTNTANVLVGTNHADVIVARGVMDTVRGRGGRDVVCAGSGNDYVDGGPRHDVVRGQVGHDTCVSSPGGGVDRFVSCEDRTAFDLQMDDALDWGFTQDAAGHEPGPGENVETTLRMGAGAVGHAGYRRSMVPAHALAAGTATVLDFGTDLDDGAVPVHLPFAMPFFGIRYHDISVSTNGWVGFGTAAVDYLDDSQFFDYRGFNQTVGNFYHGVMPFWSDLDLADGGGGVGTVSVFSAAHSVAIQWDAGEFNDGEPPRRVFQVVLFDDGRIRYDYGSSTPPDSDPNPGFVGLSSGTGAAGLDTVRRSPYTHLRHNVTLPQATIPVRSTKGFKLPGDVLVSYSEVVTCSGKTANTLTGCTGGAGTFLAADHQSVHQPIHTPGKSVLYRPYVSPSPKAPAGKVTFTLPAGS